MTQRAELDVRLQAAVAERDDALARRLADQLVHRRGLAALQALLQGPLLRFQGEEAVTWLEQLVQLAPAALPFQPEPAPVPLLEDDPLAEPEPPGGAGSPIQAEPEPQRVQAIQLPAGFSASGGAASPAPAPESLAALRAWLPGGDRDLPEAC